MFVDPPREVLGELLRAALCDKSNLFDLLIIKCTLPRHRKSKLMKLKLTVSPMRTIMGKESYVGVDDIILQGRLGTHIRYQVMEVNYTRLGASQ